MLENMMTLNMFQELTEKFGIWFSPQALAELAWRSGLALLVILLAVVVYKLVVKVIGGIFTPAANKEYINEELRKSLKLGLTALLGYGAIFLSVVLILEIFQVKLFGPDQLRQGWITVIRLIGILILTQLVLAFGSTVIERLFQRDEAKEQFLDERRSKTLSSLLKSVLRYGVYFIAGVMVLDNFGVRTGSILAGAGIIGLAVGFGAQNLVRDVITGFFIIFEDQYSVGDFVTVAGVTGTVDSLGLRTTKIREWTGQLHIIPNGEVTLVTNFSTGKMAAVVLVSIAYEEDIDKAMLVLSQAGQKARAELPQIIEDPLVQGVTELGPSEVVIRIVAFTRPGEQWATERELRKRFKQALGEAGIEIPYPRRVVINKK
jgi:small conductance mechanosensitive channel